MKIDRHGKAKLLTHEELRILFSECFTSPRDRALFGIMLYTACRVNEAVTLKTIDVYYKSGKVRPELIIRKGNTKGKLATRTIPVVEELRLLLKNYTPDYPTGYLFPGQFGRREYLNPESVSWIFREACKRADIEGASTHSFRRTALTHMSNQLIPLRVIQEVSGHRTLDELYKYLEVSPEQVRGAVASLSMLSPIDPPGFNKPGYPEATEHKAGSTLD